MTTNEIQSKLIDHYSLAIERVKNSNTVAGAIVIIKEMHVNYGVGDCARYVGISPVVFMKNLPRSLNWPPIPKFAQTKEEILSRLQLRLDILKKEYSLSIETIK